MKKILLFLICLWTSQSYGYDSTYQKLVEVNKCWTEQKDISLAKLKAHDASSEKEWIRLHLSLVEQTLRVRKTNELSTSQQTNRAHCLDILHRYWQAGNFPINDEYAYRTPIFIDPYDNFCAVGFLLKETGHENVSRMIAAKSNPAYVRDMNYPEVGIWAKENGFTIDELAWIQPSYPPKSRCEKIGNGVDGFVQELFVDSSTQQLFVGGKFLQADKSFVANNIAYVTENAGIYTWHKMGDGVNGQVNAITKFGDKIFVAGAFDSASGIAAKNIAYWDGSLWYPAGCIDGVVNDLVVFEGVLYAAGIFKSCGTDLGKNFAKWDGTSWSMIAGIEGKINTLEAISGHIVLGGKFDFDTAKNVNAIKWNATSSFQKFPNKINKEVMDFELYKDTLHAACKRIITKDTLNLLLKLIDTGWVSFFSPKPLMSFNSYDTLSFNTLCSETTILNMGGYFNVYWLMSGGKNSISFGSIWVNVDSTINKMVLFKKELIMGGKFKTGMSYAIEDVPGTKVELNGITKRAPAKLSVSNINLEQTKLILYPNPAASGKSIRIENNIFATEYSISTIEGKQCSSGTISSKNEIQLPQMSAGIYLITLSNQSGAKVSSKLIIE